MLQILECRRFTGTYIPLSKERLVKDYEIDLELGSRRTVIIDGEEVTGVTTMQMNEGLDTGDMLLKTIIPIEAKETGGSLFDK